MSTELISQRFSGLDLWPTGDVVQAMIEGQLAAAAAVQSQAQTIAAAADMAASRLRDGAGRLAYVGAGTSGRLAVQDGVELGPTYDWPEARTLYLLAGGMEAMLASVEGAEDDEAAAQEEVAHAGLSPSDVAIGVAASGRTPYTVTAIRAARAAGALTIGIASNRDTPLLDAAEHPILIETGPEIVAGSTRMKAGTAQKIVLNLLSTATMLRLGRIHDGLMVDMRLSNRKLRIRAAAMVCRVANADRATAEAALERSGGSIKLASLIAGGLDADAARKLLDEAGGNLRDALSAQRRRQG